MILAVIPCLNEAEHIEHLVRNLIRNCAELQMRIVIADGGSTDGTIEIARRLEAEYSQVKYLHNPKRIQSAAINLAVAEYGPWAKILIRLDAHAEYSANYCQTLMEEQQIHAASAVVVSMETVGKNLFQRAAAAAQNSKLGNGGAAHRNAGRSGRWVDHGHHALMRLDAFHAVGGYDESFSHNEDAELDLRLRQAGHRIWLTAKTSLTYYPRSRPAALFRQYFRFGHGRARTVMKHRALPRLRQLVPLGVAPAVLLALAAPLYWYAAIPLMVWVSFCVSYGLLLGIRQKSAPAALSGAAAMLMHFGWSLGFGSGIVSALRRPS